MRFRLATSADDPADDVSRLGMTKMCLGSVSDPFAVLGRLALVRIGTPGAYR